VVRLSSAVLIRAHRFLLEIHAEGDVEAQRRLIPQSLSRLISCDRAAFNEINVAENRSITPTPVPAYWKSLGPVIREHVHEHALHDPSSILPPHRAVTFSDRRNDPAWKNSPLLHEYYTPAGVRQQLAVHLFQQGTIRYFLNCNRSKGDFTGEDRALLELVSPHRRAG
jgi:hypothetical protein